MGFSRLELCGSDRAELQSLEGNPPTTEATPVENVTNYAPFTSPATLYSVEDVGVDRSRSRASSAEFD